MRRKPIQSKWVSAKVSSLFTRFQISLSSVKDRLLSINDLINQVLERYTAYKRGDRTSVGEIDSAFVQTMPADR